MALLGKPDTGRPRWFILVWLLPAVLVAVFLVVFGARWLETVPAVHDFMVTYPGRSALPAFAPVGFPVWLNVQHALNVLFVLFIVTSGWRVRTTKRPTEYWTRNNALPIRTKNPPTKMSLTLWLHLSFDTLWVANGLVFYVLLFSTGQWARLVPVHWDIFPHAVSTAIQYASFNWPTENGWVNYNALQVLSYFVTVFVAAPLAILTGLRMSPAWSVRFRKLDRIYPVKVARAVHFPVMVYFVAFTVVHVVLVLATGALNNLNHMYAARNDASWAGFWLFALSILVMVAAWVAARPPILRALASLTGTVSRR